MVVRLASFFFSFFFSFLLFLQGGRPKLSPEEKDAKKQASADLVARLHSDAAKKKRVATLRANIEANVAKQAALDYKKEHSVGARIPPQVREVRIYVSPPKKPSVSLGVNHFNIDTVLKEREQEWLKEHVRKEASRKDGSSFCSDFVQAVSFFCLFSLLCFSPLFRQFEKEFGVERALTRETMLKCLPALGFGYQKLKSGYYRKGQEDAKNKQRRALIVPVLKYFYNYGPKVIVWSFDECSFYPYDFHNYGWVDLKQPYGECKTFIQARGQKGQRLNVSAFISREFGVLYDDIYHRHVGSFDHDKNDSATTMKTFRWFIEVVRSKYPDYFHVVATDSPKIHTMMPGSACNPADINLSDGGKNRGDDQLFGTRGLKWIFENDEHLKNVNTEGWRVKDYRRHLWSHPDVKAQLMELEQLLRDADMLLVFHPVAHPFFAAIELLWRDMKWDYRANHDHTADKLKSCVKEWLGPSDDEMISKCRR